MYDVAVIGAGIVGASVAYLLSQYRVTAVVIEKEDDVAKGTTRANSAIIHAGYDPLPGTVMARTNLRGSLLWPALAEKLGIAYKRIGSLVVAADETEMPVIGELYRRGLQNGVEELRILSAAETLDREPRLCPGVAGALYAGTAAIVNPWQGCIAFAEYAAENGVDFLLRSPVTAIERREGGYRITAGERVVDAACLVNAAGLYADKIHELAGGGGFHIHPVRGEYYILDKGQGDTVGTVIFPTPTEAGKGVVITPTVHGNLMIGPTAIAVGDPDDTSTTAEGQSLVRSLSAALCKDIAFSDSIRNFAGSRACLETDDFILAESVELPGFINLAGIKSPGLSSAPAIAEEALSLLAGCGLRLQKKESVTGYRFPERFAELSHERQTALIKEDAGYGRVICRCETVTEGEVVRALSGRLTPATISGVKRRCNAGLGRCQGGFCSVRVHEIIARERGLGWEEVTLDGGESRIVTKGEGVR